MKTEFVVIFVTCASKREAELISDSLLKHRLASCANIIDKVESKFWWNGKIDKAGEAIIICKTDIGSFSALEKEVKKLHSYDLPEIIALPIIKGSKDYLEWIKDSVARSKGKIE